MLKSKMKQWEILGLFTFSKLWRRMMFFVKKKEMLHGGARSFTVKQDKTIYLYHQFVLSAQSNR